MGRRGEGEGGSCDDDDDHLLHLLLSEDVLIQILFWLPVISLLRFKSVCKSWRAIIESPFFIHLHATTTLSPSSSSSSSSSPKLGGSGSGSLLLSRYHKEEEEEKGNYIFFTIYGEEFEVYEDLGRPESLLYYLGMKEFEVMKQLEYMFQGEKGVPFFVAGCCDGIICLHESLTRNIVLWNPAIKQSRILPKPSNLLGFSKCYNKMFINDNDGYESQDFVRFGIDIKTNDYKVLQFTAYRHTINDYRISSYDDEEEEEEDERPPPPPLHHQRRVHVYSLSTDSWKCVDDTALSAAHPEKDIYINKYTNQGLYLNGSYFFTAAYYDEVIKEYKWDMSLLLSFDFTGDILTTIQPPSDLRDNYNYGYVYFISFGEKVALIHAKKKPSDDYAEYDIWVLNEQRGVKDPWTKFYTIGPPDNLPNKPLFITNNGEFAIIYGWHWQDDRQQDVQKLQLLNLVTGEKKVLRYDFKSLFEDIVYVYKPSLIPVGGNGAAYNSRFLEFDGTP